MRGSGMSDAAARAQETINVPEDLDAPCNICGRGWPYHEYACAYKANVRDLRATEAELSAVRADLDRVTRERDGQEKVLAACARLLGDEMPAWEPLPVRELGCASCAELAAVLEREQQLRDLAKSAKSVAAAPDYDEEAIRDALWALVDAVLAEGRPE